MIALEALKGAIMHMDVEIAEMTSFLQTQFLGAPTSDLEPDMLQSVNLMVSTLDLVGLAMDKCRNCEKDIIENRNMLILYCQQFAFAPIMVPQCASLLTCAQR